MCAGRGGGGGGLLQAEDYTRCAKYIDKYWCQMLVVPQCSQITIFRLFVFVFVFYTQSRTLH